MRVEVVEDDAAVVVPGVVEVDEVLVLLVEVDVDVDVDVVDDDARVLVDDVVVVVDDDTAVSLDFLYSSRRLPAPQY